LLSTYETPCSYIEQEVNAVSKELVPVAVGQWVVWRTRFGVEYGQVTRVAPLTFWRTDRSWGGVRREDRARVLFAGSEDECIRLHKQLESSASQRNQDERDANIRKIERDNKFISAARAAASQ
jgi:hypothetical protein